MSQFISPTDGFITKQTPVALPPTASDCLVNFNVNELGMLTKRKGTVLADLDTTHRVYHAKSVSDVELLICPYQTGIRVYTADFTPLFTLTNIYSATAGLNFTVVDVDTLDYFSVVLFADSCNPIQLFMHTVVFTLLSGETTASLNLPEWSIARIHLFNENELVNTTLSKTGDIVEFTVAPDSTDRVLTAVTYGYGCWSNSQYYFGEDLFRAVPRGDTTVDQVPASLLTQLDSSNQAQVKAFLSSDVAYNYTAQPKFYNDVYFSDGQSYTYAPSDYLTYSPYFMTFGQPTFLYTIDLSVEFVDTSANLFRIPAHGLSKYMRVKFTNEAPGGVSLDTEYVVRSVTSDTFKLESVVLTTSINTARASYELYAHDIQADGRIYTPLVAATPTPISPYRLYSGVLLPSGLVSGQKYYIRHSSVGSPSGGFITIYYDSSGQYPVFLSRFKTLQFDNTDVNTTNNSITINGHSWAAGVPVAIIDNGGTIPAGLSFDTRYWLIVDDANTVGLSTSSDLANRVDIASAGSGTFTITESWGPWTFRPEYAIGNLSVINADSALLLRARQLSLGVVSSSVRVLVDSVLWSRNTSGIRAANTYYVSDKDFNILTGAYNEDAYVYFGATPEIGLSRTSFVQLLNVRKYSGMHSLFAYGTSYDNTYDLNSVIIVYGFSDRFTEFSQPKAGAMAQNRLVLSNSNTVVLSNVADSFDRGKFYGSFGIDDRLTGESTQQFEVTLSDTSYCVALVDYQNALIVFTRTSIYRLTSLTYNQYQAVKVAEHGVRNAKCVAQLHSMLVYFNDFGVYSLVIEVQEVYYASELSATISNEITEHPILLKFDKAADLLYAITAGYFFVLNTRSNKWSLYKFAWQHAITDSFGMNDTVYLVDVVGVYSFRDVQYDLCGVYLNSGNQVVSTADGTLYVDGSPLLDALETVTVGGVPFCEDYYKNGSLISEAEYAVDYKKCTITTEWTYRRTSVVFELDGVYNVISSNWSVLEYGYPIKAVYVSACIKAEQLSFNNRVIYAEAVFGIEGNTEADMGILYGTLNKADFINSVISKAKYPAGSTFIIVKESYNGVAPVYRLVVRSKTQHKLSFSGFSLLEYVGAPMFNSGGT